MLITMSNGQKKKVYLRGHIASIRSERKLKQRIEEAIARESSPALRANLTEKLHKVGGVLEVARYYGAISH